MRNIVRNAALVLGLVAMFATWRLASADEADDAFDSPEVKELGRRGEAMTLDDEIALVRRLQRSLTQRMLVPPDAAWRGLETLRGGPESGLARLIRRPLGEGLVDAGKGSPNGDGAYWSFTMKSNDYQKCAQLELGTSGKVTGEWAFRSGFNGGNVGLVVKLRETSVLDVTESSLPEELCGAPEQVQAAKRGADSRKYTPDAVVGGVYGLRAINWGDADVVVAFQVVSMDKYGATIAWRVLKHNETPVRPNTPPHLGEGGRGGGGGK